MPNPVRLHRLIQLREAAGLTQADMAQRCGLHGVQSRKTVSAWETGEMIPRASRRVDFMHYLWCDLGLQQNPPLFEEIWTILVEEWAWEPVQACERATLSTVSPSAPLPVIAGEAAVAAGAVIANGDGQISAMVEPQRTPPAPSQPVAIPLDATVVPSTAVTADALPPPAALPSPLPCVMPEPLPWWRRWWRQRHWRLSALLVVLLALVLSVWSGQGNVMTPPVPTVVANAVLATTAPVAKATAVMATTPTVLSAHHSPPFTLTNGGFDEPVHFAGWQVGAGCDYRVVVDGATAHAGERYLAIQNRRPRCYSFYQDRFMRPPVGVTYRAAIWLRAQSGEVRRGRLALWALGADRDRQETPFVVSNSAWTCLETTLTIRQPTHDQLRFEVYLDSYDGRDYFFDSAVLGQGETPLCPTPRVAIADLLLVQPSGRIYPGATVGVQTLVRNVGATGWPQPTFVRYWVAEYEHGAPIDQNGVRQAPVPPLAAGESFLTMHMDVYLPINLPTDQPYFLVADLAGAEPLQGNSPSFDRLARAFAILPCEQGTLYCDVPADHWAAREIQAWYDAGISQSCRSYTEPFLNRPFCPDGVVQRWMMVFFLLRWLEGKDYQSPSTYQGLFEDVPEDFEHQGALWIEDLTTKRVDLRSDACPPRGEHRRFCPRDPLRRIDFVRALLELQRWDVADIPGTLFTDMEAGSQEARAAEYMARYGYLPEDDIDCPSSASKRRFCPNAPLRRASAAVMMSRALELAK